MAQDDLELRGVAALSGRDHDRRGLLPLLDGQVQLGGQAAARASEPVIVRLGGDEGGRLLLLVPFSAPRRHSWTRWGTLAILAYAFLVVRAVHQAAHGLGRSEWWRRHQVRSRTSHYRRQAATPNMKFMIYSLSTRRQPPC
ncbi:hypothetical protein [Streptomyces pseudovenezuelae]|uniref:hypothetical protein n=1 Tax=Streptomyces pseudovenezuelae TaxID=67350 RepID=UPI0037247EB9